MVVSAAFKIWEASAYLTSKFGLVNLEKEWDSEFTEARQGQVLSKGQWVNPFDQAWDAIRERVESLPTSLDG